jgi:TPR repeat protein
MYDFGQGVDENNVIAVDWYRKAAEQGNPDAQRELGLMYDYGEGVEINDEIAADWFRKAAKQGHSDAQNDLGQYYLKAGDVNISSAIENFKYSYDAGNLEGGWRLALELMDPSSNFYNPKEAFDILMNILNSGEPSSIYYANTQVILSVIYAEGIFIDRDMQKSQSLLKNAKIELIDTSVHQLLVPLVTKIFNPQSSTENQIYLRSYVDLYCQNELSLPIESSPIWGALGADSSNVSFDIVSQCFNQYTDKLIMDNNNSELALAYLWGVPNFIPAELEKAVQYIKKQVKEDPSDEFAIYSLANAYFEGLGMPPNAEKALMLFKRSSDLGSFNSTNALGHFYENGDLGLTIDLDEAFKHYKRAYDLNNNCELCITNLGRMYELGYGIKQNHFMAKIYYRQAFERSRDLEAGNGLARIALEGLAGPKDEDIAIKYYEEVVLGSRQFIDNVGEKLHDSEVTKARDALATLGVRLKPNAFDFGNYHALVIGNSDYVYLADLTTAKNDAVKITELLTTEYGFSVVTLLDATRKETIAAINKYQRALGKNDNFLLYYAGHGRQDSTDEGYWQPIDAEQEDDAQWLSATSINRRLKKFTANNILVVADSCYAATQLRGLSALADDDSNTASKSSNTTLLQQLSNTQTRVAITSGGFEPVADSLGSAEHSVFAKYLIETLRTNSEVILAEEVFQQVREKVVPAAAAAGLSQTPMYGRLLTSEDRGGDFIFKRL